VSCVERCSDVLTTTGFVIFRVMFVESLERLQHSTRLGMYDERIRDKTVSIRLSVCMFHFQNDRTDLD
jgi:hypothetical protein